MHQIAPQETFPIVYVLADPNDTGTYFVRSVMRNSASGAIIQINNQNFVNLTDAGSQRFTKNIQAPNDPSGLGFWIDITTTVYTDSGYTTKSSNYAQQSDKYLVAVRWNLGLGVGGGGFSKPDKEKEIDYALIKKLILDALNELPTTDIPDFNLSPALTRLDALAAKIDGIEIPEYTPQDFSPHVRQIVKSIKDEVGSIDLSPVIEKIDALEFPEASTPVDYAPLLTKMASALEFLKGSLSQDKYNSFLDEIVAKNLETKTTQKNTERVTRLRGHAPMSERLKKLMQ